MPSSLVIGPVRPVPGTTAGLGESPVWDPRTGRLRWVDLFDGLLHHTDPVSGDDDVTVVGDACGFVALASAGIVYAVRSTVMLDDGTGPRALVDLDPDGLLRVNDSQVAPGGWLLCGTMAFDRARREGTGRLLRVDPDGTTSPVTEGLSICNGLGWSPDGRTMVHADSLARRVDRYDFDPDSGTASGRRLAFRTDAFGGIPDGLAVDAEGRIWLAHFGTPYVVCTDLEGRELERVELPVANVTSCCFGGADLTTLYVTTTTRDAGPDHPHAGAVFAVPTSTCGQEPRYFGRA